MAEEVEVSERDRITQQYYGQDGTPPAEEKTEVTEPAPAEVEQPEEAEAPQEEVKQEAIEPPKEKTVPLAALHEERIKRQKIDEAKRAAEQRATALEAEIERLKRQEIPAEITDYDQAIIEDRKKIAELERFKQAQENLERQRQEREAEEAQAKARESFEKTLTEIDHELTEEGYGGFGYAKDAVVQTLQRLIAEDESNHSLDTKEGWKKIYREHVFPQAEKAFAEARQKREKSEKENLKRQANISTPPNKPPAKPKSPDDMTDAERKEAYMRMRRGE